MRGFLISVNRQHRDEQRLERGGHRDRLHPVALAIGTLGAPTRSPLRLAGDGKLASVTITDLDSETVSHGEDQYIGSGR